MGLEFRDIVAKKEGWGHFVRPVHKKVIPVIIPAAALGIVFYNVADFLLKGIAGGAKGIVFLIAVVFLYLWLVLQMFMLSCWIYTLAETHFNKAGAYQRYGKRVE